MAFTHVNGSAISGDATFCFYNTVCGLFDLAVVKLPRGLHAPKSFDSVARLTRLPEKSPQNLAASEGFRSVSFAFIK